MRAIIKTSSSILLATSCCFAAYLQNPRTEEERLEESDGHDGEEEHTYTELMMKYQR